MEYKNKLFYRHNQELLFDFTGNSISSDGGLLLLEKLERKLQTIKFFTDLLIDKHQQGKIDCSLEDLLKQRFFCDGHGLRRKQP